MLLLLPPPLPPPLLLPPALPPRKCLAEPPGCCCRPSRRGAAAAAVLGVALEVLVCPVHLVARSRVQIRHVVVVGGRVMVEILVVELLQLHAGWQGASWLATGGPINWELLNLAAGARALGGCLRLQSPAPSRA